jgi:acetyltransferase-like isoleucine patch superfamily enzyme
MSKIFLLFILAYRKLKYLILKPIWKMITLITFKAFNVKYSNFSTHGIPYIFIKNGEMKIGKLFRMNNNYSANIIGRQQKCIFIANSGVINIGDNVGMSSTAIVCYQKITIGDNVRIGGNTVIYDTDFHSLNYLDRIAIPEIKTGIKTKPVVIGNNVFIGGHTTILKGVVIGNNSIIGAGSVVSGTIPENEIWAGNPVKFIRKNNGQFN